MKNKQTIIENFRKEFLTGFKGQTDQGKAIYNSVKNDFEAFILKALSDQRKQDKAEFLEQGFKQGFNNCKEMVEKGEHAHCCLIPGKLNRSEGEGK